MLLKLFSAGFIVFQALYHFILIFNSAKTVLMCDVFTQDKWRNVEKCGVFKGQKVSLGMRAGKLFLDNRSQPQCVE